MHKHKAHLVAKGFSQKEGIDYTETFASVSKMASLRILLSIAMTNRWFLHQMDVENAFLHGRFDETIYLRIPLGLDLAHDTPSQQVCLLQKSIYGLKQVSRVWHHTLSQTLLSLGFNTGKLGPLPIYKHLKLHNNIILAYVDDLLIASSNLDVLSSLKKDLHNVFKIRDLGEVKYFQGLEFSRTTDGLYVAQRKYILDILDLYDLTHCKPYSSP